MEDEFSCDGEQGAHFSMFYVNHTSSMLCPITASITPIGTRI